MIPWVGNLYLPFFHHHKYSKCKRKNVFIIIDTSSLVRHSMHFVINKCLYFCYFSIFIFVTIFSVERFVLVRITIALMKRHDQVGEEKVYIVYTSILPFIIKKKSGQELKQGRDLEDGADAEAIKECCSS